MVFFSTKAHDMMDPVVQHYPYKKAEYVLCTHYPAPK